MSRSDGCWEWQRYCDPATGYGRIADETGYRKIGTHRASWIIHFGPIPNDMWVLHQCDNRKCVNPQHLFLGTCAENVTDMWQKGRASAPPNRKGTGMTLDEARVRNKIRMGSAKVSCKRGHALPAYEPGKTRKCSEPECVEARRYNSRGRK